MNHEAGPALHAALLGMISGDQYDPYLDAPNLAAALRVMVNRYVAEFGDEGDDTPDFIVTAKAALALAEPVKAGPTEGDKMRRDLASAATMDQLRALYAKWVGYDPIEDDPISFDEQSLRHALGDFIVAAEA